MGSIVPEIGPEKVKLQVPKVQEELANSELFQDVVSQFPFLNGFTQVVLGFQLAPDTSRGVVTAAFWDAVGKLTAQIPWLGGQVVHVPGGPGNSGVFRPAPWPTDFPANEIVRVKDCNDLVPSMAQILRAGAPIGMLDGKTLAPWPALPQHHGIVGPVPIIALQLNFIQDGLILNMGFHHICIDGTGILQFTRLLATVLNGDKISAAELEQANRDRSRVVPLIPLGEPVKDHSHLRRPPGFIQPTPASPPKWCYFKLPVSAVPMLRKLASSSSTPPVLLSENDLLCAFCWQRISAVRLARGLPGFTPNTVSKFSRTIDGRAAVGVPFSYIGHCVYHATTRLPLGQVVSAPLSTVAQALRRDLSAVNTEWAVRSYATFLAREPDKSSLLYGGAHNPNTDLGVTSSVSSMGDAQEGTSAVPKSFGPLLGSFRFFRRPNLPPIPGSITISPVENGAVPILVGLPVEDLEGLKKDSLWRQYMRHVG